MTMKRLKRVIILFAVLLLSLACPSIKRPSADTIITNAKVYTVNANQPWAEAVAIRGERILFVGSAKKTSKYRGSKTQVFDAQGRLVLPGIEDSHVHFVSGSENLAKVDLNGTQTIEEIKARIRKFAQEHPKALWIQGRGWMYATFPGSMPHKKFLDDVVPDRPAVMTCADGHTTWVNSEALAIAGIDRNTPNPKNGIIVRDENGEPTGALKEEASSLVWKVVPKPTQEETLSALRDGLRQTAQAGVVRVHSLGGDFEHLNLLDRLRQEGKLTTRFSVAISVAPPGINDQVWKSLEAAQSKYHDEWISLDSVKLMLDGVIDSLTGAMLQPYTGQGENKGKLFWDPEAFKKTVAEIDAKGIQVSTHAIGDAAIQLALDAYENAGKANKTRGLRHKVEHVEDIASSDIPRFGRLGVIASFQPLHANPDPNWMGAWIEHVGSEREQRAFAWKAILDTGGHLAFGSDWPVVMISPWPGIQVAVTRQDFEGRPPGGWIPQHKVRLSDAIYAYTLAGAYAMHREKDEGSIELGKLADLIVVSQNIFEIDPHRIAETTVALTMVGGKIVFENR